MLTEHSKLIEFFMYMHLNYTRVRNRAPTILRKKNYNNIHNNFKKNLNTSDKLLCLPTTDKL